MFCDISVFWYLGVNMVGPSQTGKSPVRRGKTYQQVQKPSRATKITLLGGGLAAMLALSASLGGAWLLYWCPGWI